MSRDVMAEIKSEIADNEIMLYMKGTPQAPRCGFSAAVVEILNDIGRPYQAFDVLSDRDKEMALRQNMGWPTIPQLYVDGEFVGGCDISREMHANGELEPLIQKAFEDEAESVS